MRMWGLVVALWCGFGEASSAKPLPSSDPKFQRQPDISTRPHDSGSTPLIQSAVTSTELRPSDVSGGGRIFDPCSSPLLNSSSLNSTYSARTRCHQLATSKLGRRRPWPSVIMTRPGLPLAAFHKCFRIPTFCAPSLRGYATAHMAASSASSKKAGSNKETPARESSRDPLLKSTANVLNLRTYKPRTPGLRHLKRPVNDHLWKGRAFLPLTFPKKGHGKGGRNVYGRITVRHRGGGAKRRIRMVDFQRRRPGPHLVERIEYDPGRSAHIALLTERSTGRKSYIVAADGLRAGDTVQSYRAGIPQDLLDSMGGIVDPGILASKTAFPGNCLPMQMVPVGTSVFCLGSSPDGGAVFCRSAGTYGTVVNKHEEMRDDGSKIMTSKHVEVQLQSGEIRRVHKNACATIGVASNVHHHYRQLGKAGRSRWLNIRPTVRGLAMNKVDHPHGGGRGKSKSNRHPVSPWGKPAKSGFKTRRTDNPNNWVVTPRPRNGGKRRNKTV